MEVEIRIEPGRRELKVILLAGEASRELTELARRLAGEEHRFLPGWREGEVLLLETGDIYRIYTQGSQVLCELERETVTLKARLYELEDRARGSTLVRVSHGEIVNFEKVQSLDLSMAGTISLRLKNGSSTFVSRRYMRAIKNYLGI